MNSIREVYLCETMGMRSRFQYQIKQKTQEEMVWKKKRYQGILSFRYWITMAEEFWVETRLEYI